MKVQELIDLLHSNYPLYSLWDTEEVIGKDAEKVASGLELNELCWHSIATVVHLTLQHRGLRHPRRQVENGKAFADAIEGLFIKGGFLI